MTTDDDNSQSKQVQNTVHGLAGGTVVQALSIDHVSVVGAAAMPTIAHLELLATASLHQWTAAANDRRLAHPAPLPIQWRRSSAAVAGPASAAAYRRFAPLPGLAAVTDDELSEGTQDGLHRIYGGLPAGRLLLIGPPGSGKSAAAILLLLEALRYREQATPEDRAQIPVPVLFTLHGWHPDRGDSVTDWMAAKLAETYPMFRSRAGRHIATDLLTSGRIAGFLDGLDEIPECRRPGVLNALADAPFRLVLLSRTEEAVAAAHHGPLAGAVALGLQPTQPTDAADYLLQPLVSPPPAPWQRITDHLVHRPASAAGEALSTPLALSLLRDVYGATGPVDELLDDARFPTAADIDNHLLDHAITAAYTPRPGHPKPRYTVATAQRTLRYLATQLTENGTRDLVWWHIPTWTSHRGRKITAVIVTFFANSVLAGLSLGLPIGFELGRTAGLVFGLSAALLLGLASAALTTAGDWRGMPSIPRRIARLSYRSAPRTPALGLAFGFSGGLLAGIFGGLVSGLASGLVAGGSVWLVTGLAGIALNGISGHTEAEESSLAPAGVWCNDRNAGAVQLLASVLLTGILAALTVGLLPGLTSGVAARLASRYVVVLPVMLLVGLGAGLVGIVAVRRVGRTNLGTPGSAVLDTSAAWVRISIRHRTPLRLISFLEDARRRHLLRTIGPVYQFRHATLQDRLAEVRQP